MLPSFKKHPIFWSFVLVMTFRVAAGVLFSLMLLVHDNREGHMAIILDLPAIAIFGVSSVLFGVPDAFGGAFDPAYLLCSAVGWALLGTGLGVAVIGVRQLRERRRVLRSSV